MPTEVRVLGATALFTAALVFVAWWLGQHHDAFVHQVHDVETISVAELPAFSWSEPPRARLAMPPDAGFGTPFDAGVAMEGAEAELAAILIPAICNRRRNECGCTEYPSRFAPEEERAGATTCEQDTLRDFRIWWRNNIHGPVVVVGEPELSRLLAFALNCARFEGGIGEFLRADALAGERCGSVERCRDESACEAGSCVRFQSVGETCRGEPARRASIPTATVDCADNLECVDGRCEALPPEEFYDAHGCPPGSLLRGTEPTNVFATECFPAGGECWDHDECGDGACIGLGPSEYRCVRHVAFGYDPGDHDEIPCHSARCQRGTACRRGPWDCVPVVGLGERCEEAVCGLDLACERVPHTRGHCIARSCLTSHTFRELRMSGIE